MPIARVKRQRVDERRDPFARPNIAQIDETLGAAFEHSVIGQAILDRQGRFLYANRSFLETVGYSAEALLATDLPSLHADQAAGGLKFEELWRGAIDQCQREERWLHRQGHALWIQCSASIVRDSDGEPSGAIVQIEDITARKLGQIEIARRLRQYERFSRTLEELRRLFQVRLDDSVYAGVLHALQETLESPAGLFLRFDNAGELVGTCRTESDVTNVRCPPALWCDAWKAALDNRAGIIENQPRNMGCGRIAARSLVVPVACGSEQLGLFHFCDAPVDYDDDDRAMVLHLADLIGPAVCARMKCAALTARESQVMQMIAAGMTQKQIAQELGIRIQTVAKHRAKVLDKLRVNGDTALVQTVLRMRGPFALDAGERSIFVPRSTARAEPVE